MKNIAFILAFLATTSVYSQTKISVNEETASIDGTSRNCLTAIIPGGEVSGINKALKKELKDLKGKVSDKKFLFADDCETKSMGDNSFDVYAVVQDAGDAGAKVVVAFDLGGAYANSKDHPDRFSSAQKIVRDFAVEQTKESIKAESKAAEKLLGSMEKDLAGLEKDKSKLESDIEDYKKKILEAQEAIKKNVGDQANKKTQVEGQKAAIKALEAKLNSVN